MILERIRIDLHLSRTQLLATTQMTHKLHNTIIGIIILMVCVSCSSSSEDDALKRLEDTIREKDKYNKELLSRCDGLRNRLYLCSDDSCKWDLAEGLFSEYYSYDIDSAFNYANILANLADTPEKKLTAISRKASCLCALRMYSTVEDMLSEIDTVGFTPTQYRTYYNAHITLYTALGNEFSTDEDKAKSNIRKRYNYQELLSYLPDLTEIERRYIRGKQLMIEERYDEALEILHDVLEIDTEISSKLHTTYAIANCYNAKGDWSNYKRWLAETAIYDLQRQNRQYRSLYDLALCLYNDGDYRKASEYIQITLMDAISCKHDTRIVNAVEAQMIISAASEDISKSKRWLLISFSCLMLIAIVIISLALAKVNRQRKRLKALMRETKTYNIELARKNNIISESNLLKEKYMFKYMYLSANFIKEIDEYRKDLRHTYKEKGIEALMSKLREPEYMYMQYKSFYKIFDEIFLGIFPDFPDKINSMLKEGKQINIKHKGTLPTEIRILAVIRLGITESRKIAEFLNTSVNTIYTYRTKMRYDSIDGPDKFEENVKNIDYFKI